MESPFDSGKTLVFMTKSTAGSNPYLNSSPSESKDKSVYMSSSIDFGDHPGCHWECIKLDDGSYRLKTVSDSTDNRYLDSSGAAPSTETVYLKDDSAGGGSHWIPTPLSDGSYSLQSQTTCGTKRFMSCNPEANKQDMVYLVENSDPIAAHWMVGVDYYTGPEIERIFNRTFPCVPIKFYQSDYHYGSLDYNLLHGIWNDSMLANYQWTAEKFDCDDFAVCMKAEVSKYSYNQSRPTDKGSLCGIIWGRNDRGAHAFNFTIDPFGNLILLEPQNGMQIAHNEYDPYYCMV